MWPTEDERQPGDVGKRSLHGDVAPGLQFNQHTQPACLCESVYSRCDGLVLLCITHFVGGSMCQSMCVSIPAHPFSFLTSQSP